MATRLRLHVQTTCYVFSVNSPNTRNIVACDRWYPDINAFFEAVKKTGMPYFEWNGSVYEVEDGEFHYVGQTELVAA